MNTCGTCKYFGKPAGGDYNPNGYHICRLIEMAGNGHEPKADALACVADGSGYYAALCIKEEFGCNQWTAKF